MHGMLVESQEVFSLRIGNEDRGHFHIETDAFHCRSLTAGFELNAPLSGGGAVQDLVRVKSRL